MNWTELNTRAYTPYSKTPKACIVEGNKGGFYLGIRVENISFPLTISAIQSGCCICLSEGETPRKLYVPNSDYDQLAFWKAEFDLEVVIGEHLPSKDIRNLNSANPANELERLKVLLDHAITTHSDFPVSGVLYSSSGCYEGVNIEVSDWAMGLCAERVCLVKAISMGDSDFTEFAVHTRFGDYSSPCGACRQVIFEHLPLHTIRLHHANDTFSEHFSVDLLPFSFTSKALSE